MTMFLKMFATLAVVLVASSANSQTVVGDWTCLEKVPEGTSKSTVRMTAEGKSYWAVSFDLTEDGTSIVGKMVTNGTYKVSGQKIWDTPKKIKIESLTVDGINMSKGPLAWLLKKEIKKSSKTPADIITLTNNKLVVRSEGSDSVCHRSGAAPSS